MSVCVTPTRLTVTLSWHGKVFDGPLYRRCKGSEANWILQDSCTPSASHHNANLPKDLPYDEDMGRFGEMLQGRLCVGKPKSNANDRVFVEASS